MSGKSGSGGGVGVFGLLGVAFIVLKLTGVIAWSWWLVLLPLYGGIVLMVAILAACAPVIYLLDRQEQKRIRDTIRR